MTQQEYISLVNEANKHSYLYYVESNPTISDAEFDAMLVEIGEYEQAHPEHILPDSPTQCVGSDLNGNGRRLVAHRSPMLSQQKAHSLDDIKAFMASVEQVLGYTPSMRIEWKYDGVSCSIVYIDGQLVSAATRGDGQRGQDITDHVKAMPSVPSVINQSGRVEVRGEVVCPKGQHIALGYKDERTAASAILNTVYSDSAKALVFIPWEAIGDGFDSFGSKSMLSLRNGFSTGYFCSPASYVADSVHDVEVVIADLSTNRLPNYPVDGLVIKIDYYPDFHRMGANQHHPKGSIAYKFEAASAVTTVLDIEIKVAKSGRVTPVAHIAPVSLMGKNITKVNLYSEKTMNDMGVTVGCTVKVVLQNDVTPKIVSVVSGSHCAESISSQSADNAPAVAPDMPVTEPEDVMPEDYWQQEEARQNAETMRLLNEWEEMKKRKAEAEAEAEANAVIVPPLPVCSQPSDIYMPDPEDVAEFHRQQREEARRQEEAEKRAQLSQGFKILAAVGAVVAVVGLFVVGIGMAAFFAPLLAGVFNK